jgi:hypothetical protein
MQSILDISDYDDLKLFQPPFKFLRREKQLWMLVEWTHLSTMARSYNCHFAQVFQGEEECHTIDTNIGVEGHLQKI